MKKIIAIVLTAIFAFALVGCGTTESAYAAENASARFASFDYSGELASLFGGDKNKDRYSIGSDGAKAAGEDIFSRLSSISGLTTEKQTYSFTITSTSGTTKVEPFNVISSFNPSANKRVAIFAHYDNTYTESGTGTTGAGIADNATGVVTLISLAEVFAKESPELGFGVDFVFTGSDEYSFSGTVKYLTEWRSSTSDILLAVNLETIVGSKINVYSDVVKTVQQQTFVESGAAYETVFSETKKTSPLLPVSLTGNAEYSDYGQLSGAAEFISRGIPAVSLFGWETDGFSYYKPESDDYSGFVNSHTEFATVAKDTASLIYGVLTDTRFVPAAENFTSGEGYGFFNGGYFAYIAYLGVIILLCVALIIVVKKLTKKHGSGGGNVVKPSGGVKIAVFGPEYEDAGEGDVIVDIHDGKEDNNDPFADDNN